MNLEIITPDKNLYSGEVTSVIVPGSSGKLGILKDHAPIITTLQKGDISIIENGGKTQEFTVNGGVLEMLNNKIIILAE
ncbi:MAG: ATP synthase F1 subunit epsilon [Flavobacteriales bacterium]